MAILSIFVVSALALISGFSQIGAPLLTEYVSEFDGAFSSVEIGLAELSPKGEAGGFAVPASGESNSLTQSCASGTTVNAAVTSPHSGTLYIDSVSQGAIAAGSPKTVSVSHNQSHSGNILVPQYVQRCNKAYCYNEYIGDASVANFSFTAPNCTPSPTVTISQNRSSTETGQSFTVTYGRSGGGTADQCIVQRAAPGGSYATIHQNGGAQSTISQTLSSAGTWSYRARCHGNGYSSFAYMNHAVTNPPAPTALLYVRNLSRGSGWQSSDLQILEGEDIALQWSSTNASSCGGANFSTGGATSGTQNSITNEPVAGSSRDYTVTCSGSGGSVSDQLRVTAVTSQVEVTADDDLVNSGEDVSLTWDVNANLPSLCSLTGPGVSISPLPTATGSATVTVNGQSEYVLSCPGSEARATISIVPDIFES